MGSTSGDRARLLRGGDTGRHVSRPRQKPRGRFAAVQTPVKKVAGNQRVCVPGKRLIPVCGIPKWLSRISDAFVSAESQIYEHRRNSETR